jgi:outer membrane protein assembly factor BamB/Ca2+-binding EF-hand superfamily protein
LVAVLCSLASLGVPALTRAQDWPQWRGPNRDGISLEKNLLKEWPTGGAPKIVWQVDNVGVGYSSVVVQDGRLVTQGDLNGVEHVIALNTDDGSLLWAVQPEPVLGELDERIRAEMKRLDRNQDGAVDESEALAGLSWRFNTYDKADLGGTNDVAATAQHRALQLFDAFDKDSDDQLTFEETGGLFREYFARVDSSDGSADAEALAKSRAVAMIRAYDKDTNRAGEKIGLDGMISRNEARQSPLDRSFGRVDHRDRTTRKGDELLTVEEIEEYFLKSEAGKDGLISLDELAAYYAKHHPNRDGQLTVAELRGYYGGFRNGQGDGPRGTPTIRDNRVYVEGGSGDVSCLDLSTGSTLWHVNLAADLNGRRPGWGYSESPLIVDDLLIVTPGGNLGTVAALNKNTGEVVWRSKEVRESAHYSSPVVAKILGVRQIVQFARENVFGVSLKDGKLLWSYGNANNGTANCATPIVDGNHIFASSAYGTGGGLAKITAEGGKQLATEVYFDKRMANHHGGIVKVGDYMYGFGSGGLVCMNFLTGEIAWRDRSVGKGSLVVADDMLYLLGERQEVALAHVTPQGYVETGRFRIPSRGRPSWAHPVVAGGRLYIRDQGSLTAYDIRSN